MVKFGVFTSESHKELYFLGHLIVASIHFQSVGLSESEALKKYSNALPCQTILLQRSTEL